MHITHGVEKKIKEKKKEFEKRQKEAFEQFMKAHFGDPACRDMLAARWGKN